MGQIEVRVQPRSSKNAIEWVSGRLKVWVTAAPTDGQANDAVTRMLADKLGVAPSRVRVAKGHTSREKALEVEGMDDHAILAKLGGKLEL